MGIKKKSAAFLAVASLTSCGLIRDYDRSSYALDSKVYASVFTEGANKQIQTILTRETTPEIIKTAVNNNPDIRAGIYANDYVRNLSANTDAQYLPRIGAQSSVGIRNNSTIGLSNEGRDTKENYFGQLFLSQRLPWGLSGKVFGDYNQLGSETSDGLYGAEVKWDLPWSATLARQRAMDRLVLQEPAKNLADFTSSLRTTLQNVVTEYFGQLRGNTEWLQVSSDVRLPYLERIRTVLEQRLKANSEGAEERSALSELEGKIQEAKNDIGNLTPAEIFKAKRNLEILLGVDCNNLDPINIRDDLVDIPYKDALFLAIQNDPFLRRYQIEIEIAEANLDAAGKIWDVSVVGRSSTPYHGDVEGEGFVGIQGEFSTDIFGSGVRTGRRAHIANARSFNEKSKGRIDSIRGDLLKVYEDTEKERRNLEFQQREKERTKEAFDRDFIAFETGNKGVTLERISKLAEDNTRATIGVLNARKSITINQHLIRVKMGVYDNLASGHE